MFFLWFLKVLPFCFFAAVINFFYAGFGCVMKIRWEIYGMSIHMTYPSNTIEVSEIERNKKKEEEKKITQSPLTHMHMTIMDVDRVNSKCEPKKCIENKREWATQMPSITYNWLPPHGFMIWRARCVLVGRITSFTVLFVPFSCCWFFFSNLLLIFNPSLFVLHHFFHAD